MRKKINSRLSRFLTCILFVLFGCTVSSKKNNNSEANQPISQDGKELSVAAKIDSAPSALDSTPLSVDTASNFSKPVSETVYRFLVSFYSIGEGTEPDQIEKLETFLNQYRQKSGKAIPVQRTPWGREGELDYCLNLSEIKDSDQLKFILDCKNELKNAKWVHFSENLPCRKKRR